MLIRYANAKRLKKMKIINEIIVVIAFVKHLNFFPQLTPMRRGTPVQRWRPNRTCVDQAFCVVCCEGCAYRPFGIFPRARFWLLVSFTRSVTGAAGGKPDGLQ